MNGGGMMKNILLTLIAVAGLANAHHGWAAFDSKSTVTFQSTVTEFRFLNPHSVVEFDVKDDHGQVQKWQGELTSASRLSAKGWTATTLEPGNEVTISGYRAHGVRVLRITKILSSNGTEIKIDSGN
jgi:uncharacterized protein DUF6152